MKRILLSSTLSVLLALVSFLGTANLALADTKPADTITVNLVLANDSSSSQAAQNLSLDLKKDKQVTATKSPTIASQTSSHIIYNPLDFPGNDVGTYQICVSQTDKCQSIIKTSSALVTNFTPTLSATDATTIVGKSSDSASSDSNCENASGTLGWLICPVIQKIQDAVSGIEKSVIIPFLQTQPLRTHSPDGSINPTYAIWQAIKNLADALFILIFLIIIFAQTGSFGIDAYTIKRTLPRLIAAAVLVQFSFFICSFGIDVANILGSGIQTFINGVLNASGVGTHFSGTSATLGSGIGLTVAIVGVLAVIGSLLSGAFIVTLILAFIAVIGVFLTLIARQIIIVLLIILSPIAFVMWVLPNTQNLFDMWRKNLIRILLMYPLIVLLFSSSKIVALAATNTGNGFSKDVSALVVIGAMIIPLFLVPATFKFAGSMLTTASDWANRFVHDPIKNKTENSAGFQNLKSWSDNRRRMLAAGQGVTLGADTPFGSFKKGGIGRGAFGQIAGGGITNVGTAARTRGLQDMKKLSAATLKEMEEAGLNPDGFKMVSRGPKAATAMIAEATVERDRVKANLARGIGTANDLALAEENLSELKAAEQVARKYMVNIAAQAGAAGYLGDKGMIEDADRQALYSHSQRGGKVTQQFARLVWSDSRFKNITGDPVTSFTNLAGVTDVGALTGQINSRNPDKIAAISKGGWENIAKIGALDKLDARVLTSATSGNNQTSPSGIKIIDEYREAQAALTLPKQAQGNFVAKYSILPGKYELLKKKSLLGGLIADGSGNTAPEVALRAQIHHDLDRVKDKSIYAQVVEAKPTNEVSDDDWKGFEDYKKYWMSRVNPNGTKKP